jgi:hypothetical protein
MKRGDLVGARRGDRSIPAGAAALVVDVISLEHGDDAVCILVDGRLIWVNGEMLEALNEAG